MIVTQEAARLQQTHMAGRAHSAGSSAPRPAPDPVRVLQRALGNDAMQRAAVYGGAAAAALPFAAERRAIQPKLAVGAADDVYEQEAEQAAEQILGMPAPIADHEPPPAGPAIRRLVTAADGAPRWEAPFALDDSGGQPLAVTTQAFMAPRFHIDLSHVRLHTDPDAQNKAAQIGARAFTWGHHIWLGPGESEQDRRLMAHELTHVVQQSGAAGRACDGCTAAPQLHTGVLQRAISPELDKIESYLSYGIFDWAITDADALKALELLKTLPRFQQAVFFSNPKYAGRLRENLPDARVRELDDLQRGAAPIQPATATVEDIRDKLSYGLFDWVVTDAEAVEALEKLKQLSGTELAVALAAINHARLMDNLPDARKPELADLLAKGLGAGGARATEEKEHPGTILNSISFTSDHGVMKNNTGDWSNSGVLYGEPEWFVANGETVSHPISQNRDTSMALDVSLNVLPANAPAAPIKLTGRSDEPALNFDFAGTMSGGLHQTVSLASAGKLPNRITALQNKQIAWTLEWRSWKHEIGRTRHTIFVTMADPLRPSEVTARRMSKAVELTGAIGTLDPHPLVRGIMRRWGAYNLDVQLANAWELADNLDVGAQCIDIVRFVRGLLETIGCPGITEAVVVWAKPDTPTHPEVSVWPAGGLHGVGPHPAHPTWFVGLIDGNGCPNAYEAALVFTFAGTTRFYPGGVSMNRLYLTPEDVLFVFQCLAWLTAVGPKEFEIQSVLATYPDGSCTTGRIRCH